MLEITIFLTQFGTQVVDVVEMYSTLFLILPGQRGLFFHTSSSLHSHTWSWNTVVIYYIVYNTLLYQLASF